MQTVTSADGTSIAYERRGDGPALLLLHGGGTRRYWDPVVSRFTDDYTVVTPDRRGRGDSGDGDEYSIEREVEDARAVADAVDGDPVVVGHSFGGLQGIEVARRGDVAAVVAYEPSLLVGEYREQADLAARMQAKLDAGERREAMKLHLEEVVHGGDAVDLDAWLDEWPGWPDCVVHVENTVRMDRALEGHELPENLDIDAPALLLTGTEGPPHLRDSVRAVHDALPHSRFVEFDGVGHLAPTAVPSVFAHELRAFLDTAVRR
jgi:pimeloyl-ACP methyl ester carboxylesterase